MRGESPAGRGVRAGNGERARGGGREGSCEQALGCSIVLGWLQERGVRSWWACRTGETGVLLPRRRREAGRGCEALALTPSPSPQHCLRPDALGQSSTHLPLWAGEEAREALPRGTREMEAENMAGLIHPGFRQNLESCPGDSSYWHWARWAHSQPGRGPPGAEVCQCCGRAAPPAGGST